MTEAGPNRLAVIDEEGDPVIATRPVGADPFGVDIYPAATAASPVWVYTANSLDWTVSTVED